VVGEGRRGARGLAGGTGGEATEGPAGGGARPAPLLRIAAATGGKKERGEMV
jgi:hypothetical protein